MKPHRAKLIHDIWIDESEQGEVVLRAGTEGEVVIGLFDSYFVPDGLPGFEVDGNEYEVIDSGFDLEDKQS